MIKKQALITPVFFLIAVCNLSIFGADEPAEQKWSNLRHLKPGKKIEIVTMNLQKFPGEFQSVSDDALDFLTKEGQRSIPKAEVYRVTTVGKNRARNALIGATAGVTGGLLLTHALHPGADGPYRAGIAVPVICASGGIGVGLGMVVSWPQTLYRANRPTIGK